MIARFFAEGADMIVVSLLVVILILLYAHQADRDCSLEIALLIGVFTWLAIEIHLLRILAGVFALALEHWMEMVMLFSAGALLIVPVIMIYIAVCDRLDEHRSRHEFPGIRRHKEN